MVRTKLCQKVFDSGAEPYIEQKDVILCRSGIQNYHKSELKEFMDGNPPPVEKEWYRECRPANVIVKAKKLCASLPVTKEHPDDWVTPDNWKELAGGTTDKEVEVVALDGEADGEIGLKSNLTFYDRDLYAYYEDNNREVSLGYNCKKRWVENPDEVGYDIILEEITEVNHLAITKAGRGGSSVAIVDSILGGLRPMRTGIFAWLNRNKQTDSKASESFGATVFDSLKKSNGKTEDELAKDMQGVLASCSVLKDCEAKDTLINVVKDCFDNKEKALQNEKELVETLDSMYVNVSGDSLEEIANAFKSLGTGASRATDSKDDENEDGCHAKDDDTPTDGSKSDKDDGEGDNKDAEADGDKKDGANKDSLPALSKADVEQIVRDSVKPLVVDAVKEALGITKQSDSVKDIEGSALDSIQADDALGRDYSSFIDC